MAPITDIFEHSCSSQASQHPVAAGLLTNLSNNVGLASFLCYQVFLGFRIRMSIQAPQVVTQTVLDPLEVSIGVSVLIFAQGMGLAFFVVTAVRILHNRLTTELTDCVGPLTRQQFEGMGLGDIRNHIGGERLEHVVLGFDKATMQTLYLPVVLTFLTLLGSLGMERCSAKKQQQQ